MRHPMWADPASMSDEITPTAAVQAQLSHLIGWLDRRSNDPLWINDGLANSVVELRLPEMKAMIAGLRQCADMLSRL